MKKLLLTSSVIACVATMAQPVLATELIANTDTGINVDVVKEKVGADRVTPMNVASSSTTVKAGADTNMEAGTTNLSDTELSDTELSDTEPLAGTEEDMQTETDVQMRSRVETDAETSTDANSRIQTMGSDDNVDVRATGNVGVGME